MGGEFNCSSSSVSTRCDGAFLRESFFENKHFNGPIPLQVASSSTIGACFSK